MRPGKFTGVLTTDWINPDWEQVHQCKGRNPRWSYITSRGKKICPVDGFLTDLGSVPRLFQNIIRRDEYKPSFVIHDYCYDRQMISRREADAILFESIYTMARYSVLRRWIIYLAVRGFGRWAWRLDSNADRAQECVS